MWLYDMSITTPQNFKKIGGDLDHPKSLAIIQRKFPENTKENYGSEYFEKFYVLNLQNVIE